MSRHSSKAAWVPSLFFTKGVSYVIVTLISLVLLRQLGLSAAATCCFVAFCHLPWMLKCWWKPYIDRAMSYRWWIIITQFLLAVTFAAIAFLLRSMVATIALLYLTALLTAIHNVAADGFFRQGNTPSHLSTVRELSRKFAVAIGQGMLVMAAGNLQVLYRNDLYYSWQVMFYLAAGLLLLLFFWHWAKLPMRTEIDTEPADADMPSPLALGSAVVFLFFYPFAQGIVGKASVLFLIDATRQGGLGLSPQEFGFVMGTVGIVGLTVGGLWGKSLISRWGPSSCLWLMSLTMLVPALIYTGLGLWQPTDLAVISICVLADQLAYGFGFAAYLQILGHVSHRETAKSVMALSLLLSCLTASALLLTDYYTTFLTALALSLLSPFAAWTIRKYGRHFNRPSTGR